MNASRAAGTERPWFMTLLAATCVGSLLLNVPRDFLFPEYGNVEVWFGFELTGWAAWLTAPIHWAIFAFGAWAFWTCRPWSLRAGAIYTFYVALSHVVWSEASPHGGGWLLGLLYAALLSIPGFLMLYWQPAFRAALARRAGAQVRASQQATHASPPQ